MRALLACTPQEQKFVMNYVGKARGNATLAAQLAGIGGGYSAQASRASIMLRAPHVRKAVEAWMEAYAMSAIELTWRVKDMTYANVGPFTQWQSDGTPIIKAPDEETWEAHKHWIKSIKCDPKTGKVIDLELHDPMVAQRELAKILKLYSDAPIIALAVYARQLSDEELLQQIAEARAKDGEVFPPSSPQSLPPGTSSP